MAKKTTSVDGAPQEEAAKKTVKKTRSTRATSTSSSSTNTKRAPRTPRKKKTEQPEQPVVEQAVAPETPVAVENIAETPVAEAPVVEQKPAEPQPEQPKKQPEQPKKQTEQPKKQPEQPQKLQEQPSLDAPKQKPHQDQPSSDAPKSQQPKPEKRPLPIPPLPNIVINDIVELANAPKAGICLTDQQIQQLTLEDATRRFQYLEYTLANILDYDVVLSDTNIWLELLIGHTSSHSDPRVNARLQFERQLEFISKLTKHRGGRFMMMSETYEEIDRFATAQEPTNYRDADWSDEALCRNVAARLAKRLILSQQRENRLRIEGIGAESHHASFADPAIIRRTVEMFAQGRKVLLLTNDASVGIRSMGMCDDLQRHNRIDDRTWDAVYAPLRPMVMTMDDLKILDNYTRQYHFLQVAAGMQWMQDIPKLPVNRDPKPTSPVYGGTGKTLERKNLALWEEGFRPGDRHERHSDQQARQKEQQRQKEAERQRQAEAERQRQAELQKQKEAERQRQLEEQRQRQEEQRRLQSERDRARQQEINRQKELEAQQKQAEELQKQVENQLEQPSSDVPQQQGIQQPQPADDAPATEQLAETPAAEVQTEDTKKRPSRRGGGRGRSSRSGSSRGGSSRGKKAKETSAVAE